MVDDEQAVAKKRDRKIATARMNQTRVGDLDRETYREFKDHNRQPDSDEGDMPEQDDLYDHKIDHYEWLKKTGQKPVMNDLLNKYD